jgi:hypothetical protein
MSIVTLKHKVQAQYNNSSVGQPQFSLNGTRRSSGYIGQDTLGRSLVRSLSKNGALKGHGGCCGKYPISQIKTTPEMSCLNNAAVVKPSSISTKGLLESRHRWIRRPQPYTTVKPDNNLHNNIQSVYIENLARKAIVDGSNCHVISKTCPKQCALSKTTNYNRPPMAVRIVKPDSFVGAIDGSDHIRNMDKKCGELDEIKHLNPNRMVPFACGKSGSFVPLNPNRNDIRNPGLIGGTNVIL